MNTKFYLLAFIVLTISCKKDSYSSDEETVVVPRAEKTSAPIKTAADNAHNSMNSVNYTGTYNGVIPCADCEGIKTSITLSEDGGYKRSIQYLGKEKTAATDTGIFTWNAAGSEITLSNEAGETQSYKVGENVLFHLDRAGNRISGDLATNYKLTKKAHVYEDIENKKWILVELIGKPLESQKDQRPFLLFNAELSRVSGNNSCNNFEGNYDLKGKGKVSINNTILTGKACDKMATAASFHQVIQNVDNYTIVNGVLNLNRSKMATLAKFELQ
jgi:uncharacterized lipoprotein NlpE involved in copper resistance